MKQRKVYIRENSWLAKKAARKLGYEHVAMVLGHTIYLHNTTPEQFFARPGWVCHELRHVAQYERLGTIFFLIKYGIEHLRKGYRNNVFEEEARASESDRELLRHYDLSAYAAYMKTGYDLTK